MGFAGDDSYPHPQGGSALLRANREKTSCLATAFRSQFSSSRPPWRRRRSLNFYWMEFPNSRNLEIGLGLYLVARFYLYLGGYADGRQPGGSDASTSPWPPVLFADDPTVPPRRRSPGDPRNRSLRPVLSRALGRGYPLAGSLSPSALWRSPERLLLLLMRGLELVLPLEYRGGADYVRPCPPAPSLPTCNISSRLRWGYSVSPRGAWGSASSTAWFTVIYSLLSVSAILGLVTGVAPPPQFRSQPVPAGDLFLGVLVLFLTTVVGVGGADRELEFCDAVLALALGLTVLYLNVRAIAAVVALTGCALVLVLGTSASALLTPAPLPKPVAVPDPSTRLNRFTCTRGTPSTGTRASTVSSPATPRHHQR